MLVQVWNWLLQPGVYQLNPKQPQWKHPIGFPIIWMVLSQVMFPMSTVFFIQTSTIISTSTGLSGSLPKYFRKDPHQIPARKPPDILLENYETARPLPTRILLQKDNYSPDFHRFMENRYRALWAKQERNLQLEREVDSLKEQGELPILSDQHDVSHQGEPKSPTVVSQQGEPEIPTF